jgi:hypothetical protein
MWDNPETSLSDEELEARVEEARKLSLLEHFRRNDHELRRRMKRSWKERAEIYRRGGREYWSEGDLSWVIWTEGGTQLTSEGATPNLKRSEGVKFQSDVVPAGVLYATTRQKLGTYSPSPLSEGIKGCTCVGCDNVGGILTGT